MEDEGEKGKAIAVFFSFPFFYAVISTLDFFQRSCTVVPFFLCMLTADVIRVQLISRPIRSVTWNAVMNAAGRYSFVNETGSGKGSNLSSPVHFLAKYWLSFMHSRTNAIKANGVIAFTINSSRFVLFSTFSDFCVYIFLRISKSDCRMIIIGTLLNNSFRNFFSELLHFIEKLSRRASNEFLIRFHATSMLAREEKLD